jgi:Domain of unknown function (DUF929)
VTDDDQPGARAGLTPEAEGPMVEPAPEVEALPLPRPRRNRTAQFAWAAVAVILVAVIALVTYALTDPPPTPQKVQRTTAAPDVVAQLAKVPTSVFDTVGATAPDTALVAPTVLYGQPLLAVGGKPEVLYVGAEYCPFCASERWPLIVALSRFGHFTDLKNMQSAALSVFPGTQTFSFVGSTYASRYLAFSGVEIYSDAVDTRGTYARIATLSPAQALAVAHYGNRPGTTAAPGGYPFVDVGNRMTLSTSSFSPALLVKQSQAAIAGDLSQAASPITQAVVASANQLTAGMCMATAQQPTAVCTSKGVRDAAASLGVS